MMSMRRLLVNRRAFSRSICGIFQQEPNQYCTSIRSVSTYQWRSPQSQSFSGNSRSNSTTMVGLVATSMAFVMFFSSEKTECEATKNVDASLSPQTSSNPIGNVNMLLRLYEQIDQNMEILCERMLKELKEKIELEKKNNQGQVKLSPEQRALNMSIQFETTLERVQDAVFRNNYVTKEQVEEAIHKMMNGELPGAGQDGRLSIQEAEAIETSVKRLGRLRWKCTGSREPLIPVGHKRMIKQEEAPKIPLEVVVRVMEELIPSLTKEMETIVHNVKKAKVSKEERHHEISKAYLKRSSELTQEMCHRFNVQVEEFQNALIYYHDEELFEQTLAHLSKQQEQKFRELGL